MAETLRWDEVMGAAPAAPPTVLDKAKGFLSGEAAPVAPTPEGTMRWDSVMGVTPPAPPSLWDRAKAAYGRTSAVMEPVRATGRAGLEQVGKESTAAANMLVGLPGGVASVGMDAMSRLSSLFQGDSPKAAGQKARAVADQVNTDWVGITDKLGLSRHVEGSKIDQLMQWGMEASDKGGATLERATKGVLSLETTQSVRDALLNVLGVKGLGTLPKARARPTAEALTPEAAIKASQERIAAMPATKLPADIDPTLTPPPAPTKAEAAAHAKLVDSIVVDKGKLKEIFVIAKKNGPEAEAALVQNIFDRVLKPQEKAVVPPRAVEGPVPVAEVSGELSLVDQAARKLDEGLLLTAEEAKAARRAEPVAPDARVVESASLVGQALAKLEEGKLISAAEAKAVRGLRVDAAKGLITDAQGMPRFQKGAASPELLKVLAVMGLGAVAAKQVYDWWTSSELPDDNALGLAAAAGAGGVIKGKGGMWHPETVRKLAGPLERSLYTQTDLLQGTQGQWAQGAVRNYLNRHAGTATDPIKDLRLPDGTKWEDLTDNAFVAKRVAENAVADRGALDYGEIPQRDAAGAKIGETVWRSEGGWTSTDPAFTQIKSYLSHVGDYLRSQNLPPEKLQQYDLPRAIRETVANDQRIAKEALKDFTKPNPVRIENTETLPTYKSYPPEQAPARTFSFNKDGSLQKMESIDLPAGEVQYAWKELALQDRLTEGQMKRIVGGEGKGLSVRYTEYKALDAKGKPIIDNFSREEATGATPQEAHLAGQLAEEGNALGHCVGGYCVNVLEGNSRIISLRDQLGRSYATVELVPEGIDRGLGGTGEPAIAQIKGPGNGPPADYVRPYIQDFVKSGKWGEVRDLENTGLLPYKTAMGGKDPYVYKSGTLDQTAIDLTPGYYTKSELAQAYAKAGGIIDTRFPHDAEGLAIQERYRGGERGSASTRDMALLAGGTGLALYLYNSTDSDEAKQLLVGAIGAIGLGKLHGVSEPRLIEMLKAGGKEREAAATKIYLDNAEVLERSLRKYEKQGVEIEDVVQRTMEKGLRAMEKGQFAGDSAIQTYLYRIADNEAKTNLRYEKVRPRTESMDLTEAPGAAKGDESLPSPHENIADESLTGRSPEQVALNTVLGQRMAAALEKLPENFRRPFEMREFEGMEYQEISDALGVPLNTVRTQILRAKEKLQASLKEFAPNQRGGASVNDMMKVAAVAGGAAIGAVYADDPQQGAIVGGILALGGLGLKTHAADRALGRGTTRLMQVDPTLRRAIRDMEHAASVEVATASNKISAFIKPAKKLSPERYAALDKAYSEADPHALAEALKGNPELVAGYAQLRSFLQNVGERLVAVGRFKEGLPDYLPLMVKDYKGLMESLGMTVKEGLEGVLHKANLKSIKTLGRELNEIEKAVVVNNFLLHEPSTSYLPGYAKARRLKMTEATRPFYHTMEDALIHYAHAAVEDLATTKFFGQDTKTIKVNGRRFTNVEGSIGALVTRAIEEGRMTPEQAVEAKQVIRARFIGGEKAPAGGLQDVRNVTSSLLLGQIGSGLIQTSEGLLSAYHHGLRPAVEAAGMLITRRGIKPAEFGLANHVIEEVVGSRASGRVLSKLLKLNLLAAFDQLGMEQNLTASFVKNKRLAETPAGRAKIVEKWGADYGPDMPQLLQELQQSTRTSRTPLVDSLLYQELSDVRPTSRAEAPELFNAHPNARLLYHLKQFMLTQADILRRDAYMKIKTGEPRQVAIGLKNLTLYAAALSVVTIPSDIVKDWIMGRELRLDKIDYVNNFVRNFGLSRYTLDKVSESRNAGKAMVETVQSIVTPPALSAAGSFATGLSEPAKLVPFVPLVGRAVYNREFGGNEKAAAQEAKKERLAARAERERADPRLKAARLARVAAAKKRAEDKLRRAQ
jgi:RNA polymerase sigma-70 factor (ECF subfamily)